MGLKQTSQKLLLLITAVSTECLLMPGTTLRAAHSNRPNRPTEPLRRSGRRPVNQPILQCQQRVWNSAIQQKRGSSHTGATRVCFQFASHCVEK